MTDTSPILAMPYIQSSQAQKHVTHNEALRLLDVIVQLAVRSADLATPPATAVEGDRYIVAAGGQGAWAGQDTKIAAFIDGSWQYFAPLEGWRAQVLDSGAEVVFDGTGWAAPSLSNLEGLGIGAGFDAYNRLVVSSDAVLLNNAGAGHQVKVNKATIGDTASLLFQTGYGGRAEMGTAGSDDFTLKVSADGGTWIEALRVDAVTGRMVAGVAGWREVLAGPRVYYVDQALGDDGAAGLTGGAGAFATLTRAVAVAASVDSGGFDITIQLADGTYSLGHPIEIRQAQVGGGQLILQGNPGNPAQVILEGATGALAIAGDVLLRGVKVQSSGSSTALRVGRGGKLEIDAVSFGAAGGHFDIDGGILRLVGACTVDGAAAFHLRLSASGQFDGNGQVLTLNGTPAFSDAFLVCSEASIARLNGQSFSGDATGKPYHVATNSVVQGGGVTLPGNLAGTVQSGGIFL